MKVFLADDINRMLDVKTLEHIHLILLFVVPGLIAVYVRAQFITGRRPPHSEALLSYLAISIIYYALALPLYYWLLAPLDVGRFKIIAWFAAVFVGPAILGALLGLNAREGFIRNLAMKLGFNPVHVMPTAWDWKFSGMPEQWVLVTLKNGTRFAGYCGLGSFISSDPNERDIYLDQVYEMSDDNAWSRCDQRSVLIACGEVSTVEFWPTEGEGTGRQ